MQNGIAQTNPGYLSFDFRDDWLVVGMGHSAYNAFGVNFEKNQFGRDRLAENKFQEMFIHTTMLRLLSDFIEGYPEAGNLVPELVAEWIAPEAGVVSSRSYQWYQQHLYAFDQLETVPSLPGGKFVYAHFYSTHQPYVFKPDGSLLWPINEDNDGYVAAVNFTAYRILRVIDHILRDAPRHRSLSSRQTTDMAKA